MRVTDVAAQYEVSSKSIYTWLREGVIDGNRNLILENNRLKKENEQLYRLLGRATAEMQKSKN
jgi:predicted site-specific integrase-resolvase